MSFRVMGIPTGKGASKNKRLTQEVVGTYPTIQLAEEALTRQRATRQGWAFWVAAGTTR